MAEKKTKVVILNQYYVPDVASTGHLLHELAVELAKLGFEVEVLTGRPSYGPKDTWQDCPLKETVDGVKIHRLKVARFDKNFLPGRAFNYLTFVIPMVLSVLLKSKKDTVYLYTTNPPFLGAIGWLVSLFRRHHYVTLLHDAHPQLGVWVGTFKKGSMIERVWMALNRRKYKRTNEAIVLCSAAKKLVAETYPITSEHIHVIPNWADGEDLFPIPKTDSQIAQENGFVDDFILLYSGNMGLYYDFDTVLEAAKLLEDEPFKLVLVGGGGKKTQIENYIKENNMTNVVMLPYQPFERLNESLNSCDASLVTIAEGIEGISFPSKLYTSLAVGKAIVALSEDWSELRQIIEHNNCGIWSALGDSEGLASQLRGMIRDKETTKLMSSNARVVFEKGYTRQVCAAKYAEVLKLADPQYTKQETDQRRDELQKWLAGGAAVVDMVEPSDTETES
ncbi:MAG: glycosyltransferase family 4 protein [Phycisphaerales bacterium]|jgi:glycosyltransferase involved in cell wall biosynthesis|nr:glycosyltransferase family 4 protein [Phycisphaerales bacterium]